MIRARIDEGIKLECGCCSLIREGYRNKGIISFFSVREGW